MYKPRPKGGKLFKEILRLGAGQIDSEGLQRKLDRELEAEAPDDSKVIELRGQIVDANEESIALLYKQVSILLHDEKGKNPDPEDLEETLDIEDARELVSFLMPTGSDEGNSETTPD